MGDLCRSEDWEKLEKYFFLHFCCLVFCHKKLFWQAFSYFARPRFHKSSLDGLMCFIIFWKQFWPFGHKKFEIYNLVLIPICDLFWWPLTFSTFRASSDWEWKISASNLFWVGKLKLAGSWFHCFYVIFTK